MALRVRRHRRSRGDEGRRSVTYKSSGTTKRHQERQDLDRLAHRAGAHRQVRGGSGRVQTPGGVRKYEVLEVRYE